MDTENRLTVVAGQNTAPRIREVDFEDAAGPEQIDIEGEQAGHNSKVGGVAAGRLLDAFLRIERLEEEKKGIQESIADIFKEMTSAGFDKKAMKEVLKRRKMGAAELSYMDDLIATYEHAAETEWKNRQEKHNPGLF